MTRKTVSIVCFLGAAPSLFAAQIAFDCVTIPANPTARPLDCDDLAHPFYDPLWCTCLKTYLRENVAGDPAAVQQAIIEVVRQPTIGKYVLTVKGGTLELGALSADDEIGQLLIDAPIPGQAERFLLDFQLVVTAGSETEVEFDVIVRRTNATSMSILGYNPMDAAHAGGLTYRGKATSFGVNGGFELIFEYVLADQLPVGATSTGIQTGDLLAPGFSIPVLITFPTIEIYTLPSAKILEVETVVDQLFTDPVNPVQRTFAETLDLATNGPKPPAAPADLVAVAGDAQAALDWADNAEADLQGYNVYRSQTSGGPYAKIAGPVAMSAHTDAGLTNGTTYYYVVRAVNAAGESLDSSQASATPEAPAPAFRRGDANGDGSLDLTDPIFVLGFQFLGGPAPACFDAADADDLGTTLDLTDGIYSLQYQFLGGPAPPAPGPAVCGADPTPSGFPPCVYDPAKC